MKKLLILCLAFSVSIGGLLAQNESENVNKSRFKQLDELLPTPNVYRTGSGAPGHQYWQQQADYEIDVEVNDDNQRLTGSEKVTYTNNSPDDLKYLWVQLDQNMRAKDSDTYKIATSKMSDKMTIGRSYGGSLAGVLPYDYDGGHKIQSVKDKSGKALKYTINKTMMRVEMPEVLKKGMSFTMQIDWYYNINDRNVMGGRGGFELFPEDGNYLYTITQWFPRMAVYDDINGWQTKQFLGRGEFALPFGDYKVNITVPADHIVASTGVLQNPKAVLTSTEYKRFQDSKNAKKPLVIVSQKEAEAKEKKKASGKKTWTYHAENVRDFAFGSSRKFIWDAMGVKIGGKTIMAMSYYPKEANPLYGKYSTEAVAHTLEVYSKYTIDYPYPVAISVEASNGMEYPMICFNYGRPQKDGTYSPRIKYGMLGVVIHEVGHNFFPMIINSDERQWTWMDEGLNSFVQYLAEQEWERGFPSRGGNAYKITDYMKGDKENISPIMTNSESIHQFGNNAYSKPATALNILRETVMGRELFDYAFKEYSRRWAFKHPSPSDFFRTMEDASGMDLDWFWRGWFYTTDHVDISIEGVSQYQAGTPMAIKADKKTAQTEQKEYISDIRNKDAFKTRVEKNPELADFYNTYDPLDITDEDKESDKTYIATLGDKENALLKKDGKYFYEVAFKNIGGLVMPIVLEFQYEDGTSEVKRIPAEIWKMQNYDVTKVFATDKKVKQFLLDPHRETADTDTENNYFPRQSAASRFQIYKRNAGARGASRGGSNPMQKANKKKK
jgi:hypothetical protein